MSIVNKMLNDLEQRESQTLGNHANYQPPEKSGINKQRVWVYSVVLLIVLSVGGWLLLTNPETNKKSTPVSTVPSIKPIAQTSIEPPQEPETESLVSTETPKVADPVVDVETELPAQSAQSPTVQPKTAQQVVPEVPKTTVPPETKLAVAPSTGNRVPDYQMLAADALANNNTEAATKALKAWMAAEPNNLAIQKKLSALLFANGDSEGARNLLLTARNQFPNDTSLRMMLARYYLQRGQSDDAWEVLQIASTLPDFLFFRATTARQQEKYEEAQQDYRALTQQLPNNLKAWLGFSVMSDELGAQQQAIAGFMKVRDLAGNSIEIRQYAEQRLRVLEVGN